MMTFPLHLTWEEIANLPNAADAFCWDESEAEYEPLIERIATYSEAFTCSPKLTQYLDQIGYSLILKPDTKEPLGIFIRNEAALITANALFNQVQAEYDTIGEHPTPTWEWFGLGGDDYVDYCGSQPSCLSGYLRHLNLQGDLS